MANINPHLKVLYEEGERVEGPTLKSDLTVRQEGAESGEFSRSSTVSKMETVQPEGTREVVAEVECDDLETIIAAAYRVNGDQATQFRIWATKSLRASIVKGHGSLGGRARAESVDSAPNYSTLSNSSRQRSNGAGL